MTENEETKPPYRGYRSKSFQEADEKLEIEVLTAYAKCWNISDTEPLQDLLQDDFVYESQTVLSALESKEAFLDYFLGKLTYRNLKGQSAFAELGTTSPWGNCVIIADGEKENLQGLVFAKVRDGKIIRMDMCIVPSPHSARRSGVYPGLDDGTWHPPSTIVTRDPPRQILAEDFPSLNGGLPIQGGWGYTREDACIICKDDPLVDQSKPFNGVEIEYVFVEKRIYEELITFRNKGEKHSGIKWKPLKQGLIHCDDGRSYDHLRLKITCHTEADRKMLKERWENRTANFDEDAHWKLHESLKKQYVRDFWFDITSFFGE